MLKDDELDCFNVLAAPDAWTLQAECLLTLAYNTQSRGLNFQDPFWHFFAVLLGSCVNFALLCLSITVVLHDRLSTCFSGFTLAMLVAVV